MFTSRSNAALQGAAAPGACVRATLAIGYTVTPCSLGFVIIARSEQSIRSIMVGDDPEMLLIDVQNQFPHHTLSIEHDYDAALVARVVGLIEHHDRTQELPLDIHGADFQMRVWDALQKVPAGTAVSYTFLVEHMDASPEPRAACTKQDLV